MDYLDLLTDPAIVLIVTGGIIFILGFAGCVGALRENTFLLMFFYLVLIIVLILEVVVFIVAIVFTQQTYAKVDTVIERAIINYREDLDLRNLIDFIQMEVRY
ncbi:tetraspanin-33-like [Saccoglossus kowalevskii]